MAWFIGQSAVTIVVTFVLGLLVAWLIWGRRLRVLVTEVRTLRARATECDTEHLPALRAAQAVEAAASGRVTAAGLHIPAPRAETTSVSVPPPPDSNLIDATTVEITHFTVDDDDDLDAPAMVDDDDPTEISEIDELTSVAIHEQATGAHEQIGGHEEATGTVAEELALVEASAAEPAVDDLVRIEGIGPKFATALVAAGIRTYDQLASADATTLIAAIRSAGLSFAPSLPTWSQQARLLADGDEDGFAALTARLIAGRDVADRAEPAEPDDLARIEGIGPKIAAALVAADIRSFRRLADSDDATLKEALGQAGLNFAPSLATWAQQAKLLADGDEDGFAALTARLIAGRDVAEPAEPAEPDDLARIEGIGPKIAAALVAAGIRTYRALAGADQVRLRNALQGAGLSFAPSLTTWAQQAKLLAEGDEEGFADLTRRLVAGRDEGRE